MPGEGSVLHTLAELKRLCPYTSVSSSIKWDQESQLPQTVTMRTVLGLW